MTTELQIQKERWDGFCEELKPLAQEAWSQKSVFGRRIPLDINWDQYKQWDEKGVLFCVTARADNRLVGYVIDLIVPHPESRGTICAAPRAYWIVPEYRARAARYLFKTVERLEKEAGVVIRQVQCKPDDGTWQFFEALGYGLVEVLGSKWLA